MPTKTERNSNQQPKRNELPNDDRQRDIVEDGHAVSIDDEAQRDDYGRSNKHKKRRAKRKRSRKQDVDEETASQTSSSAYPCRSTRLSSADGDRQFVSLDDIFWSKRKPKSLSSPRKKAVIQYSKSYTDLFTRDLSIEECNGMEAFLTQQRAPQKTGLALPHPTTLWNIFSTDGVSSGGRKRGEETNTVTVDPRSNDSGAWSIPPWLSNEMNGRMEKPEWKPLGYHLFYDSKDYVTKTGVPRPPLPLEEEVQEDQEEEVIESSSVILGILSELGGEPVALSENAKQDFKSSRKTKGNASKAKTKGKANELLDAHLKDGDDSLTPDIEEKQTNGSVVAELSFEAAADGNLNFQIESAEGGKSAGNYARFDSKGFDVVKTSAGEVDNGAAEDRTRIDSNDPETVYPEANFNDSAVHCQQPPQRQPGTTTLHQLSSPDLHPIFRACTVLAYSTSSPDFALGDTAGYITVYSGVSLTSVTRLETDASRRHFAEMKGVHLPMPPPKTENEEFDEPAHAAFFRSALVASKDRKESLAAKSLYAIEALCFVRLESSSTKEGIAYATKLLVELLDQTGSSLWRTNLDAFGASPSNFPFVIGMDGCPFGSGRVCIGFQDYCNGSPLALVSGPLHLETSHRNMPLANVQPIIPKWGNEDLLLGPRAVAAWSKQRPNALFFVVIVRGESETVGQQLITADVDPNSGGDFRIVSSAVLPVLKSVSRVVSVETISLTPDGQFVAVASSGGGIRVFKCNNLELIGVYGEGIKMHGHVAVWQKVLVAYVKTSGGSEREEHDDELALRYGSPIGSKNLETRVFLMAASHPFREPKDLRDTVHVWDISNHLEFASQGADSAASAPNGSSLLQLISSEASRPHRAVAPAVPRVNMILPTFTVPEPPSSQRASANSHKVTHGIQSLLFLVPSSQGASDYTSGARLILTTHGAGECFVLERNMRSCWAGCMYDPEYLVVGNNVDYIEDEDELDYNVDAYREIMLKQKQKEELALLDPDAMVNETAEEAGDVSDEDEGVDVLTTSVGLGSVANHPQRDDDRWQCGPELYLQSAMFTGDGAALPSSTSDRQSGSTAWSTEGKLDVMISMLPPVAKALKKRFGIIRFDSAAASQHSASAARRRTGRSIEALIVSSINEDLQNQMTRREVDLTGHHLSADIHANGVCFACLGRLVTHSCGRRLIPEDTDAILREEEERKKNEKEEEKRRKLEKKKSADFKRKEALKRHKEELEREAKDKQEWLQALRNEEQSMGRSEEGEGNTASRAQSVSVLEDMAAADLMGLKTSRTPEQLRSEVDGERLKSSGNRQWADQSDICREAAERSGVTQTSIVSRNSQLSYGHGNASGDANGRSLAPSTWNSGHHGIVPKCVYDKRQLSHQNGNVYSGIDQSSQPCGSGSHQLQQYLPDETYYPQSHSNPFSVAVPSREGRPQVQQQSYSALRPHQARQEQSTLSQGQPHQHQQSYEMFRPSPSGEELYSASSTLRLSQAQQQRLSYEMFRPPQSGQELYTKTSTWSSNQGQMQQVPQSYEIYRPTHSVLPSCADQGHRSQDTSHLSAHPSGGTSYRANPSQTMFSCDNFNFIGGGNVPPSAPMPDGRPTSNSYSTAPQSVGFQQQAAAPFVASSNSAISDNVGKSQWPPGI